MYLFGAAIVSLLTIQLGLSFDDALFMNSVSNCSCDLSQGKCDTWCCCDTDCDDSALASFNHSCVPGLSGGFDAGQHLDHNCSRNGTIFDQALHSLLCIQISNTAFLGSYHESAPVVGSLYLYDQLNIQPEKESSYEESSEMMPSSENLTGHYKVGMAVKTLYDRDEGILGTLSLPSPSLQGGCVPSTVRFLKPMSSQCNQPINPDICLRAKNSYLDHQMYIMSSVVIEQEPNFAQVLASNNQLMTAETETFYYVTNNVQFYLNTEEKLQTKAGSSQENFSTLKTILVRRDGKSGLFHNSKYSPYNNVQSVAHLNPESNSCNNLVLEVRYELFWAQTEIVKVGL